MKKKNLYIYSSIIAFSVCGVAGIAIQNQNKLIQKTEATVIEATAKVSGNSCYLTPNSDWKTNSAVFSIYFYNGSGVAWSPIMTAVDGNTDGVYQTIVPTGGPWTTFIGVRLKNGSTSGSWDNKWNQTNDLSLSGTINGIQITGWDKSSSNYTYTASSRADLYGTQLCAHTASECTSKSVTSNTWDTEKSTYWDVMGADAQSYFTNATADGSVATGRTGGAARYDIIRSLYGYTNFASR